MLRRRGKAERLANPASKMAEQVVADVFMRPSEGRNSMLLKLKKGLSALCHISQAGINTL